MSLAPPAARPAMRRTTTAGFRLRGRTYKAVLTAHILTSVGWFGAAIVVAVLVFWAGTTSDKVLATSIYRVLANLPRVSIPLGIAAALTGGVLSVGTTWGLFKNWWVIAKILITIAVVVTDAVVISHVARDALASGVADRALYDGSIAHVVALTVATVISVFKPKGKTPWQAV
ncbi:MAG: hypothetical protein AB7N24_06035 [Dehalococcoidia bacterium]